MADEQLKHLMNLYEVNFRLYHLSLEDSLSLLLLSALLGWIGAWLSVDIPIGTNRTSIIHDLKRYSGGNFRTLLALLTEKN